MTKTSKPTTSATQTTVSAESDLIRNLAELINETNLSEIEYEKEGVRIKVARNFTSAMPQQTFFAQAPMAQAAPQQVAAPSATPTAQPAEAGEIVKSPMVGVLYLSPEPGSKNFVNVGDSVKEGQTICLIEAMKTFNSVAAPKSGIVRKIIAKDASPIEFEEAIMVIE